VRRFSAWAPPGAGASSAFNYTACLPPHALPPAQLVRLLESSPRTPGAYLQDKGVLHVS
jgi:hypothetical protein